MTHKLTTQGLVLTSMYVQPEPFAQFQKLAVAEGTTASALIRRFVLQTVRKASRQK